MAFREVTMLEVKEVLRLWLLGVPKKRIAKQLGFDVKTVRRYLAAARAHGADASHGIGALDDALVAAVVKVTQPETGRLSFAKTRSVNRTAFEAGWSRPPGDGNGASTVLPDA